MRHAISLVQLNHRALPHAWLATVLLIASLVFLPCFVNAQAIPADVEHHHAHIVHSAEQHTHLETGDDTQKVATPACCAQSAECCYGFPALKIHSKVVDTEFDLPLLYATLVAAEPSNFSTELRLDLFRPTPAPYPLQLLTCCWLN